MRKLILKMSMSVDGFVGGPNGEIDWLFKAADDGVTTWTMETIQNASLHLMGSRTYGDMMSWWPTSDHAYAGPMNSIPKAVFTRRGAESLRDLRTTQAVRDAGAAEGNATRRKADPKVLENWQNAYVAAGPIAEELSRMKAQSGKPLLAHGGAGFARSLLATGLVDEYRLLVYPVVLGRGLPIFTEVGKAKDLKLADSTAFPSGAIANVYHPS